MDSLFPSHCLDFTSLWTGVTALIITAKKSQKDGGDMLQEDGTVHHHYSKKPVELMKTLPEHHL